MPYEPATAVAALQFVQIFFFRLLTTVADYAYQGQFWGWAWGFIWGMVQQMWSFLYRLAPSGTKIGNLKVIP